MPRADQAINEEVDRVNTAAAALDGEHRRLRSVEDTARDPAEFPRANLIKDTQLIGIPDKRRGHPDLRWQRHSPP
jgi:hypothetical protein